VTVLEAVRTEEECRAVLRAAFPGLAITSLGYLAEGWDSTVFAVNGTHVFRFPKRAGVDATLRKEIRLLPALVPVLPIPIPEFDFVSGPTTSYAWHIVGYRMVLGTPADGRQWGQDDLGVVAPALAAFLRALHSFPADRAVEHGAPSFTPRAWIDRHAALYRRASGVAEPLVPEAAFARFVADWERMLAGGALVDFAPVLIHGDLAMEHVLVDGDGRLSGVIDFGDAMVADPALDFAGFPDGLAQRVLVLYTDDPSVRHGIWLRRVLYHRAGPLHALTAGVELGRDDLVRSGVDALRRRYG
jgi:aminoglycoside 2''-phosphotransferase